eukprot:TRINITY_DN120_c1_g1_i5.p1 TRINITY_DN120_c1_g1~~TRINITY_DN120_c1_g1_i5.p1  ORF type:complete len:372 (-),score=44.90 TRINITY_DN120_c1_g1_i5:268-1356(-)
MPHVCASTCLAFVLLLALAFTVRADLDGDYVRIAAGEGLAVEGDADGFGQGADLRIRARKPGGIRESNGVAWECDADGLSFSRKGHDDDSRQTSSVGRYLTFEWNDTLPNAPALRVEGKVSLFKPDRFYTEQITITHLDNGEFPTGRITNFLLVRFFAPQGERGLDSNDHLHTTNILANSPGDCSVNSLTPEGGTYAARAGGALGEVRLDSVDPHCLAHTADSRRSVGLDTGLFESRQPVGTTRTGSTDSGPTIEMHFLVPEILPGQSVTLEYRMVMTNTRTFVPQLPRAPPPRPVPAPDGPRTWLTTQQCGVGTRRPYTVVCEYVAELARSRPEVSCDRPYCRSSSYDIRCGQCDIIGGGL